MPSVLNDIEVKAMSIDPRDHSYPFENLIFEGGGNKGLAYCGAVRVRLLEVLYFKRGGIQEFAKMVLKTHSNDINFDEGNSCTCD